MVKWCGDLEHEKLKKEWEEWEKEANKLLELLFEERKQVEKLLNEVKAETIKTAVIFKGIKIMLKGNKTE